GILTRLPESVPYIMAFYTLKGMVEHKCRIESYYKDKGSYLMKVRLLDKGKPIQHRQFFRFECMLPIKYNIIREGNLSSDDEKAFSGIIRDLSGGGLCFQANEDMKVGQKIRFSIELDTKLLIAIGTVLRKTEPKDGDYRNEYNVVYSGITGADQERIVRHIFAEQRHNLNVSK
ncbi:MAG: PilZ domain-containing protein, partial [Defluviitaleaceae bacterium]|nr:PilZ domain-containing protein [Defluviitaleaceae bacterium]